MGRNNNAGAGCVGFGLVIAIIIVLITLIVRGCEAAIDYVDIKKPRIEHNSTTAPSMSIITCPHCNGTGKIKVIVGYQNRHYATRLEREMHAIREERTCPHCKGLRMIRDK